MTPGLIDDFRKWARHWLSITGMPRLLIVDPGGTTGMSVIEPDGAMRTYSIPLSDLPAFLDKELAGPIAAVICEDYSAHGKNVDPKAVAAIGKGMVWSECARRDLPMFLFQPNVKKAGRAQLDEIGLVARTMARNDHQRDVIDLAGKARHELRKASHEAGTRIKRGRALN